MTVPQCSFVTVPMPGKSYGERISSRFTLSPIAGYGTVSGSGIGGQSGLIASWHLYTGESNTSSYSRSASTVTRKQIASSSPGWGTRDFCPVTKSLASARTPLTVILVPGYLYLPKPGGHAPPSPPPGERSLSPGPPSPASKGSACSMSPPTCKHVGSNSFGNDPFPRRERTNSTTWSA